MASEDQRAAWRKALASHAAAGRRHRYRPRKTLDIRAGMVRLTTQSERPAAETGRHSLDRNHPMTDYHEPDDWPECQPPDPPASCRSCGEPFTAARPFVTAFGSSRLLLCPECWDLFGQLESAEHRYDAHWPGNYALAALDLDETGRRRAAGLFAALGWCDPQDTATATLRALFADGAKPFPPDAQVRHDWIPGDQRKTCARCGEIRWELRTSREW